MDGLSKLIKAGDCTAVQIAKTMLTTPTLLNTDLTQGMPYALPLDVETYRQSGSAQVSENLLIVKNGKKNIADNVAPGAWAWDITGYIRGNTLVELTNLYTPFVRLNTDILKQWFETGAVLIFKDIEARIYSQVVIQSLTIEHQKDCANAAPFSMTLKEINVISDSTSLIAKAKSIISEGSVWGTALKVGVAVTSVATITSNLYTFATN